MISASIRKTLLEETPGKAVLAALERFFEEDAYLLRVDANERSITHRFATYLQMTLPELHVDCEYNRDGIDPKRLGHLSLYPDAEDSEARTVFPDVIAHIRGKGRNFLVVEIKKTSSSVDGEQDYRKLVGYKAELNYEFALFLEFAVGDQVGVNAAEWIA